MKLKHIGITINSVDEISGFYENVLEMKKVRSFALDPDFSKQIFNISLSVKVYLMKKDDIEIELFIYHKIKQAYYDHYCLSFKDRQKVIEQAIINGYEIVIKKRIKGDLVIIKDHSGNIFEIKELL